jgi:hypothetical protein
MCGWGCWKESLQSGAGAGCLALARWIVRKDHHALHDKVKDDDLLQLCVSEGQGPVATGEDHGRGAPSRYAVRDEQCTGDVELGSGLDGQQGDGEAPAGR